LDGALSPARAETSVDAAALPVSSEARLLSSALKLSLTVAEWLVRSGHRDVEATRRFLNPRLAELSSPEKMADRRSAAARIAQAIRSREKICVFGDYDCDGMTAAAIMTEALTELGGDVATLLASRFDGGYGVSATAVDKIAATGARLLVTCDCGSSDHPSLRELARRGLECIVIDHHLVPDEPLPAFAFLNPHRPDCGFDYKGLASCGLALSMAGAVRSELGRELDLKQWLDLVAIGTIADVAPLDGDNRALVRAGLRALADAKRPGLRALLEQSRFDFSSSLGSEDISYRIAPRLNAPGRLGSPDLALRLLLERSPERAYAQALEIEQLSQERRGTQDRMLAEALLEIEEQGYASRPAIVVGREGWNHGIVGIVAGRLAAQYQKPVIVFGFERGQGRGSVRGPLGSRLHDMLTEASEVLVRFGGHQAAAGCEVRIERLGELRERFERAASNLAASEGSAGDSAESSYLWLQPGEDPARVVADLSLLEPFGTTNPAPDLAVRARVVSAREVTGGHLKLELELERGRRLGAFGPTLGHRAADLGDRVAAAGKLRKDTYRGGDAVELKVDRFL
jgi:single-stranded-DNA-specific exonuclease